MQIISGRLPQNRTSSPAQATAQAITISIRRGPFKRTMSALATYPSIPTRYRTERVHPAQHRCLHDASFKSNTRSRGIPAVLAAAPQPVADTPKHPMPQLLPHGHGHAHAAAGEAREQPHCFAGIMGERSSVCLSQRSPAAQAWPCTCPLWPSRGCTTQRSVPRCRGAPPLRLSAICASRGLDAKSPRPAACLRPHCLQMSPPREGPHIDQSDSYSEES